MRDELLTREQVFDEYRKWYEDRSQDLSAYFGLVTEALTRIDRWDMRESKRVYGSILRAMLSPAEKYLLFYHALMNPELGRLVQAHGIFEEFTYFGTIAEIPDVRWQWLEEVANAKR